MRTLIVAVLALLGLVRLSPGASAQDAGRTGSDGPLSIALTGSSRNDAGSLLTFGIRDERDGSDRQLSVSIPQFDALHAIHNYQNSRLVLVGSSPEGTRASIVDLRTGKVQDSFLAHSPQVSPDGRYVAYRNPEAPSPERDSYLVYDVAKSSALRRSGGGEAQPRRVGYPVFPREEAAPRASVKKPASGKASERRPRSLASKITWLDNAHFAFADLTERRGRLVVIDLTRGVTSPRAAETPYARGAAPRIKRIDLLERIPGDQWRLRLWFEDIASAPNGWLDVTVGRKHFVPLSPRR